MSLPSRPADRTVPGRVECPLSRHSRTSCLSAGPEILPSARSKTARASSGGSSSGALWPGALLGRSRQHSRLTFQLVTGVSAGALKRTVRVPRTRAGRQSSRRICGQPSATAAPLGYHRIRGTPALSPRLERTRRYVPMVDRYVTLEMINAVARTSATGRRLIVATAPILAFPASP
jgi:hypothetical protein